MWLPIPEEWRPGLPVHPLRIGVRGSLLGVLPVVLSPVQEGYPPRLEVTRCAFPSPWLTPAFADECSFPAPDHAGEILGLDRVARRLGCADQGVPPALLPPTAWTSLPIASVIQVARIHPLVAAETIRGRSEWGPHPSRPSR